MHPNAEILDSGQVKPDPCRTLVEIPEIKIIFHNKRKITGKKKVSVYVINIKMLNKNVSKLYSL